MDRYRLIAGIVVCFIYLLAMFPIPTIIVAIILAIAYFLLSQSSSSPTRGQRTLNSSSREWRRREALNNARIYLAPHNDIWRNLKLSNTYCSLRLQSNGYTIVGRETVEPYRTFRVVQSRVHSEGDLWDMFCNVFDHNTKFDGLVELCRTFQADIKVEGGVNTTSFDNYLAETHKRETPTLSYDNNYSSETYNAESIKVDAPNSTVQQSRKEKLDVNNASEVELTALPGISIVLAKKIIKKRDDIGGFKDVNSFLLFTQLKPHMQNQLSELVCVNKMKGAGKIKRNNERSVDL